MGAPPCGMQRKAGSYVDTSWYMSVYHSVYRGKIRHVWCIVGGSCWVQQVAVLAISAAAFLTTLGISVQFCIHPSKRQGKLSAHPGDYCVFVRSCSWKCIQLSCLLGKINETIAKPTSWESIIPFSLSIYIHLCYPTIHSALSNKHFSWSIIVIPWHHMASH